MTEENIDKTITYRDAYGKPATSFYYQGQEIDISKITLDKKLLELIRDNSNMLRDNSKIMRITSKL